MATYTPNLNLKKPSTGEKYDVVADLNDAKDKIDNHAGAVNAQLTQIAINVKTFGAKGDGITDDTAAIQDALNYVDGLGGGTVLLPQGVYLTSYTLLLGNNTTLLGNGATVKYDSLTNGGAVFATKNIYTTDIYHNVYYRGITLDGSLSAGTNGFCMVRVNGGGIFDCYSDSTNWHLVDLAGCKNIRVEGNHAENSLNEAYQIDTLTEAGGIQVALENGNTFVVPADGSTSSNIYLRYNKSINNKTAFHIHRDGQRNIYIEHNSIESDGSQIDYGITNDSELTAHNIYINHNTFTNIRVGLRLLGSFETIHINNNYFIGNEITGYAIRMYPDGINTRKNVVIKDNHFDSIKLPMSLDNTQHLLVQGNVFYNCADPFDGTALDYNISYSPGHYAISVGGGTDIIIDGNLFDLCKRCVIRAVLGNPIDRLIIKNNVQYNSGNLLVQSAASETPIKHISILSNIVYNSNFMYYMIRTQNVETLNIEENYFEPAYLYAVQSKNVSKATFRNNTLNVDYVKGTGTRYGYFFDDTLDIKVLNNVFIGDVQTAYGQNFITFFGNSIGEVDITNQSGLPWAFKATTSTMLKRALTPTGQIPTTNTYAKGSELINTSDSNNVDIIKWVYNGTSWKALTLV